MKRAKGLYIAGRNDRLPRWIRAAAVAAALVVTLPGCTTSVRVTDPDRTATEQFLLSAASSRAVEQVDVENLRGRRVWIDTQYFAGSEQPFVVGELRARLLTAGVQLIPEREEAEIVMEVRSGGVGIDRSDLLVGIPSVLIRAGSQDGDSETLVPLATPEFALVKNIDQRGIASVAYVAYWRDSGEVVAASGPHVGWSRRADWWFLGLGRRRIGDIPPLEEDE